MTALLDPLEVLYKDAANAKVETKEKRKGRRTRACCGLESALRDEEGRQTTESRRDRLPRPAQCFWNKHATVKPKQQTHPKPK